MDWCAEGRGAGVKVGELGGSIETKEVGNEGGTLPG